MSEMQPFAIPESICPACGYHMDAAKSTTGQHKPKPDDFTVCMMCAQVFRFGPNLELQPREMSQVPSEMWDELDKVRCAIKTFRSTPQVTAQ